MKKITGLFGICKIPGLIKTLKFMKLTVFLILISVGCALAGKSYSQTTLLSLEMNNSTIKEVLDEIEEQSEFRFMYSGKFVDVNREVSLDVKNRNVETILDILFSDTEVDYTVKDRFIVLVTPELMYEGTLAVMQQRSVSGRVTDAGGQPLPGVTVVVKGTTQGTVTNSDGEYSINNIPEDALLVFSFVGMRTQEVPIGNQSVINVILEEETIGMDEVSVVGYGTQLRANLTGAIGQIDADEISARPSPNITTALQGLMPGLNVKPNSGNPINAPEINVRGFNSLNGGSPLVLIDGIEGQLELINPSDVESITVLKDAASSAIYGARGSFGVILVTTKKGEEGDIRINYNNNYGFATQSNRTDYIADPYEYGRILDAGIYGYNGSSFTGYNEQDWEIIRKVATGEFQPFHETLPNGNNKFYYNTNWYDYLFKKWIPSENHNISLSGGSDRINGYLSGRYYKTDDINNIATGNLIKYNLKGTLNFKVNEWLSVSGNIQYN